MLFRSLQQLGCDLAALRRCPWYERLDQPLPLCADRGFVLLHADRIRRVMEQNDMHLLDVTVRPVDVEEWNALIAATDNKSKAHFHAYGEVLARLAPEWSSLPTGSGQSYYGQPVRDARDLMRFYNEDLRRQRVDQPAASLQA